MQKQAIPMRRAIVAAIAVAALSLPLMSAAQAQQINAQKTAAAQQCKVVGAIWHRCYLFHSDATWPDGTWDHPNSNG